jgi:copper resistance protein B
LLLFAIVVDASAQQPPPPPPSDTPPQEPLSPIPVLTDEDRAAAFPDPGGHAAHDRKIFSYVLFDQLEWQGGDGTRALIWDNKGWIGGDVNRLWFRTEGESGWSRVHEAQAHLFYGRAFSRWWDFVAGVRQDVRPGPAQTWAAVGVQGLAPYFFEVEATAYVGASGRTQARLEAEYEMLITNRLILQPRGEVNLVGKSDPQRGVGSGLSTAEAGLRMRYEFRREFAPYVGIAWNQKFGRTADFSRANSEETRSTRLTLGIRLWF